jgi:MoaA/NifB/PqqE/SkfB family radical SAM enzyme
MSRRWWGARYPTTIYRDLAARPDAGTIGRDELHPPSDDLAAALGAAFDGAPTAIEVPNTQWLATDVVPIARGARYVDITVVLDLPWEQTRDYVHSKLYFAVAEPFEFSEADVICFRFRWLRRVQTVRLRLPDRVLTAGQVRLRLDPFPYCTRGTMFVHSVRFAHRDDDAEATRIADLYALKEQVQHGIERAELAGVEVCEHLPGSLSVELTARCNLTCGHCSSHGEPDLHRRYNRTPEMSLDRLRRLADEVFPSLTSLGLVGRGEPLATSNKLWEALVECLRRDRVFLTAVTNGTMLQRRMTSEILPMIETLTVSVDGATPQTFARHRRGAQIERVLEQVGQFHDLRRASGLTRRPRLGFSWTLMRDNITEFPGFVRDVLAMEPDLVYARHLLVFFERVRGQSLLGHPDEVNPYLRAAYDVMSEHGINMDCPPLMSDDDSATVPVVAADGPPRRDRCMFVHRTGVVNVGGEVPTCSAPWVRIAGQLDEAPSFNAIWNGAVLREVRRKLDTDEELDQCRNCWYREGRYSEQRRTADLHVQQAPVEAGSFTNEAWDFTDCGQ